MANCTLKSASAASVELFNTANEVVVSRMVWWIALKRVSISAFRSDFSVEMAAVTAVVTFVVMSASAWSEAVGVAALRLLAF